MSVIVVFALVVVAAVARVNPYSRPYLVSPSAAVISEFDAGVPLPAEVGLVVDEKTCAPVWVSASTMASVPALSGYEMDRFAVGVWESVVVYVPLKSLKVLRDWIWAFVPTVLM